MHKKRVDYLVFQYIIYGKNPAKLPLKFIPNIGNKHPYIGKLHNSRNLKIPIYRHIRFRIYFTVR